MNVKIKDCPIEIANDIWNAAIEETAKMADVKYSLKVGLEIRKLKK